MLLFIYEIYPLLKTESRFRLVGDLLQNLLFTFVVSLNTDHNAYNYKLNFTFMICFDNENYCKRTEDVVTEQIFESRILPFFFNLTQTYILLKIYIHKINICTETKDKRLCLHPTLIRIVYLFVFTMAKMLLFDDDVS